MTNDSKQRDGGNAAVSAERRADAAERTIEVLKRKVFDLYNGDGSSLQKQLESARRREDENRRKRELSELRANELKRYSETLEAEVERRTEAIKTIVDNVTFGFLVVNRELIVEPECTRSCQRLFGAEKVSGASLCDLLDLSGRSRREYILSADQVFEDVLPTEVSLAQMRRAFPMKNGLSLKVEGSVIRQKGHEVSGLLFTISDITALEAVMRENKNNRTLVGILRQRESFRNFVADSRHQLAAAREACTANLSEKQRQASVRHAIHTIKGNSASYGLDGVADLAHRIEENSKLGEQDVDAIVEELRLFLDANRAVLGFDFDAQGAEGFEVTREQMNGLRELIAGSSEGHQFEKWTTDVLKRPAWQLLGPIDDFSQKLAVRLGKRAAFELSGGEILVDTETMRPIFQVVSHLARNAVDHGIERPLHRGSKPAIGHIRMRVVESDDEYVIEFEDDGAGINVDVLASRAASLGLFASTTLEAMSREEKLALIFVDGLSSAEVTTSISGRGVGMSAVKSAVESAGGTIDVRSEWHHGTTVRLTVPKLTAASALKIAARNEPDERHA